MNSNNDIFNVIQQIKEDILATRNKVFENANFELLSLYFRIGKIICENSKYGNQFIENLSISLKTDFPDSTGYSKRNLSRMKKFYDEYKEYSILPPPVAKLPWTHNCILIDKISDIQKRFWYAEKTLLNGWGKVVLDHQIDLKLYERQADNAKKLTNFDEKLPKVQGELAKEVLKDPYMGQLQFYVSAIDEILKKDIDNNTIGLLLCKKKDKKSVEWSLKSVNVPVGVASYEIQNVLPTEDEINKFISAEE